MSGTSSPNATATDAVIRFILETRPDAVSASVSDAVIRSIVDTVACMMLGTASQVAGPLRRLLDRSGTGPSRVFGWRQAVPTETAAMINATFGHADDYDEVVSLYPGHPGSVVLGALLAECDGRRVPGQSLLCAHAVGVEVGAQLGRALGRGHYLRGWHPTATLGVLAATAALCHLHGFGARTTARALGIAASASGGLNANFGTMAKPLHSGWAAHSAVLATRLADAGCTASEQVFDGDDGFLAVYGDTATDPGMVAAHLGRPWVFDDPGVGLKPYPCCYAVHRAVDGVRALLADPAEPSQISRIDCVVPPGARRRLISGPPRTPAEAKFSLEYAIATTVLDGTVSLSSFSPAAVARPAISELFGRIHVTEDAACLLPGPGVRDAHSHGFFDLTVVRSGGEQTRLAVRHPAGSPSQPLSWEQLEAKFADCARHAGVPAESAGALAKQLEELAAVPDVMAVLGDVAVGAARQ
jgi:2-methylcitrate dehydratase PrpD